MFFAALFCCQAVATAQTDDSRAIAVDGNILADGTGVTLTWTQPGAVSISRRPLGATERGTWQWLADVADGVKTYTDATTQSGVAYEYQVFRPAATNITRAGGYWATGVQIPAVTTRGVLLLIVDDTMSAGLAPELSRLTADLVGDGWKVVRHDTPRHGSILDGRAQALKSWIKGQVALNPGMQHALYLFGRVPYVLSGYYGPDGHGGYAQATDLYYADLDGVWTDSVIRKDSSNTIGDGKYDHDGIPSTNSSQMYFVKDGTNRIETWVGRVDFQGMSADSRTEVTMLRDYLNKSHAYRQVMFPHPIRSYASEMAYDESPVEQYGIYNIVGKDNTVDGRHYTTGQEAPALWGADFGDYNGNNYPGYDIKAVFTVNFGSGKQKWEIGNNAMRGLIAQRWYTLACGWGVRPNWYIHHMALGYPIGYSHFRTANNSNPAGTTFSTNVEYEVVDDYGNTMRNGTWIDLMGDPTIRAFMPEPPSNVLATAGAGQVALSWTASPSSGVHGYLVERAPALDGDYTALNGGALVAGTAFVDNAPVAGGVYRIRAQRLEVVRAGSFQNLSQAAFAKAGNVPPVPTTPNQTVRSGRPATFTFTADDADGDTLTFSRASEPAHGSVAGTGGTVVYTPAVGFYGTDSFAYSVWDGTHLVKSTVTVQILEPSIPPAILSVPADVSGREGVTIRLPVAHVGDLPLTYQWYKDGVPLANGGRIQGADTAELVIQAADPASGGGYHVKITSPVGEADSESAPIMVAVQPVTPAAALVVHFPFDEGAGTSIRDASPAGNDHTTTHSTVQWLADGKMGGGLGPAAADGALNSFQLSNADDLNFDPQKQEFTISVWFRTTTTGTYKGLFMKNNQYKAWLVSPGTSIQVYVGGSSVVYATASLANPVNNGSWHHLALVNRFDVTASLWKGRLYYDGVMASEFSSGSTLYAADPVAVGRNNGWSGHLDDFRIYRKALDEGQIAQLIANTLPAPGTYAAWAGSVDWNGQSSASGSTNPTSGQPNLLLYALDVANPANPGPGRMPEMTSGTDEAGPVFHFDYVRRQPADDLVYRVMQSEDLQTWSEVIIDGVGITETVLDPDPDGDGSSVKKRVTLPVPEGQKRLFLRLSVETNK